MVAKMERDDVLAFEGIISEGYARGYLIYNGRMSSVTSVFLQRYDALIKYLQEDAPACRWIRQAALSAGTPAPRTPDGGPDYAHLERFINHAIFLLLRDAEWKGLGDNLADMIDSPCRMTSLTGLIGFALIHLYYQMFPIPQIQLPLPLA